MGRPKASKQNLSLALAFANAITVPTTRINKNGSMESCVIPEERLFQAFSAAFPSLVRDSRAQHRPTNQSAVSQIEFRKFLIKEGDYAGRSIRHRIGGLRHRWESAKFMWSNRRYVDLNDPKDLAHFEANMQAIRRFSLSPVEDLDHSRLIQIIQAASAAPSRNQQDSRSQDEESGGSGSDVDDPEPDEESDKGEASRSTARWPQRERGCVLGLGLSEVLDIDTTAAATASPLSGCLISSRQHTSVVPRVHPPTRCFLRLRCDTGGAAPADGGLRGLPPWSVFVANGHYQIGVSVKYLSAIFGHVPPDLRDAIIGAVAAIKVNSFAKLGRSNALRGGLEGKEPWTFEGDGFDVEELAIFDASDSPVVRYTYHPVTRQLTEFYANQAYCRLVGLAPEALCAMVATHDLPDRTPQLDYLCAMLETMLSFVGRTSPTEYFRWQWPGSAPVLVQREGRLSFDVHGRNWRHAAIFRPVSPADFDRAAARGEMQLDLRRTVGAFGSGRRLVGTLEADMRETIEGLAGCAAGRRRLGALAGEVRRAFGPAMARARGLIASGSIAGSGRRLEEAEEAVLFKL